MDEQRRLPRKHLMEESRTSGLNSMDILHCRRLIMDSLELFELSMAEDDENEWLFMSLGTLNLLEYVHMNLKVNFVSNRLPKFNILDQYIIANQDESSFPKFFCGFQKSDAHSILTLLRLPRNMRTVNNVPFLSETGFLLLLK